MYTFESRVRYSETDCEGKLTMASLINYFQDCSTFQSVDIKYSVSLQIKYMKYPLISRKSHCKILDLFFLFHFFLSFIIIMYLFHLHFQCYPKSPPHTPTPTPPPTHSHLFALAFPCTEACKVCTTNGPLFRLMADQAMF